jgi:hypothetical protein
VLDIKHVSTLSSPVFFSLPFVRFFCIDKYLASYTRNERTNAFGFSIKCPLLLSDFGQNCNVSTSCSKPFIVKFREHAFSCHLGFTFIPTGRHSEAIRGILKSYVTKVSIKHSIIINNGARGSLVGWGTMLQAGRSWVQVPMRWMFSIDSIHPAALCPRGRLSL